MKWFYWSWKNFISMENIKKINKKIKNNKLKLKDSKANSFKNCTVNFIEYKKIENLLNNWGQTIHMCNNENFGLTLFPFSNEGILHQNIYSKNNEYRWHMDVNSKDDAHDYKFTSLLNISEKKYKGGLFQIRYKEHPTTITELTNPGDMIMIRSNILHRVTPITQGNRQSLTMFLKGPKFQ
tara:strand:- start:40 stop:582 length:543 start_codon:yes stop_codon:yes gene_type:complete